VVAAPESAPAAGSTNGTDPVGVVTPAETPAYAAPAEETAAEETSSETSEA
jgi:hypothetical protein